MKRREFVAASVAAGLGALAAGQSVDAAEGDDRQVLELQYYSVASQEKLAALEDVLAKAFVPAWNRLGIEPVGVFLPTDDTLGLYVLLPHPNVQSVLDTPAALLADAAFVEAAKPALTDPQKDPLYQRIESSLLLAFKGCPKVECPTSVEGRVFQLRIYESHNLQKHFKKVEMFNDGGELRIFRECGMNPVFFGQAIIGGKLPNLTYMLGFDSEEAQKEGWKKFLAHPDWQTLKNDPQYAETVSNITNIILKPSKASQI